jgi:SagB-type dehydrogenase family enzyme
MPLLPNQPNLLFEDYEWSEDESYYLSSKINSGFYGHRFGEKSQGWQNDPQAVSKSFSTYKSYAGLPRFELTPNLERFRKINWEKVVLNRRSSRTFIGLPVTLTELSNMLVLSCGLKDSGRWLKGIDRPEQWPRRALPSGGGMYPLEFYLLVMNVTGLPQGLYHFDVPSGQLTQVRKDPAIFRFEEFWAQQDLFQRPAVIFYGTAIFQKSRVKYGARALRYILLEAGGIGAHMNLVANAMDVEFCYDGGGWENKIEEMIGIDGQQEGLVSSFMIGHTFKKRGHA